MRSFGFHAEVPKLMAAAALGSWASHLAMSAVDSTNGIRSRKFARGQSRLTVAKKSSILRPRLSASKLCASSTTKRASDRSIRLLRIARDNFSGVETSMSKASVSAVSRSFSKASTSTAEVNCSTRIPMGPKSFRSRRVIWLHRARVGAT